MAERKAFLLRLDPAVWVELERLAQKELRSVNAQIEFLLRNALQRAGRLSPGAPSSDPESSESDSDSGNA
jgi:hypothetical protein